jgi:hypothetical protein
MADIRPMSFGEILDGSLKLYRHNFGLFLQIAIASLAVPVALIVYFTLTKLEEMKQAMMFGMMGGMLPDLNLVLFIAVIGIAYGIGSLMLGAAAIRVVSDSYLGRTTTFGQAIGLGVSKIIPLFLVSLGKWIVLCLLGGLIMGGAMFLFVFIGGLAGAGIALLTAFVVGLLGAFLWIWVAAGYGVTTPVVVLEQLKSSFDAFGRSWDLTKGSRAKLVGLAIVAVLLFQFVPQTVIQVIAGAVAASNPAVGMMLTILSYVVPVILAPAISCVYTLIYYDMRVRREAFDLQVLSQQLGA